MVVEGEGQNNKKFKRHVRVLKNNKFKMSNFKKTPIANFTKGSVVTSEECKYWKQLGVCQ